MDSDGSISSYSPAAPASINHHTNFSKTASSISDCKNLSTLRSGVGACDDRYTTAGILSTSDNVENDTATEEWAYSLTDTSHQLVEQVCVDAGGIKLPRQITPPTKRKAGLAISKYMSAERSNRSLVSERDPGNVVDSIELGNKNKLTSITSANLLRLRKPTSRFSPSRETQVPDNEVDAAGTATSCTEISSQLTTDQQACNTASGSNGEAVSTRWDTFVGRRIARRPLSTFIRRNSSKSTNLSIASVPRSFSFDKLSSLHHNSFPSANSLLSHKSASSDRLQNIGTDLSAKKDELWSSFRALDGDFHKFDSRPITSRTLVVRSTLIPFLKTYAEHCSNTCLRVEDLERRINVLNRWWTGLIEMLNGRNGESVSGNDRAVILEAATAIMVRPEWNYPPPSSSFRPEKTYRPILTSRSTTSLVSTGSDFLSDLVFYNVRNIYAHNLMAQMAFVVDKMSARHVAASVVSFCGKAIAYAFFYCDGVAEILVRLWAIPSATLRQILIIFNARYTADSKIVAEKITARFPHCLHALSFKPAQLLMKHLRSQPRLPRSTACIPWHGPWVTRWAGKDSDLFFVFTKSYHTLVCRLLSNDPTQEDLICAPAYALVQAQILRVLNTVLQHTNDLPLADHTKGPSPTFDDILGDINASAKLLPLPPSNGIRSMAENRLIILLRDFLSGSPSAIEKGRNAFAHSFENVIKAATLRISVFDHKACFTLCDFLEEAIVIMSRFYRATGSGESELDWTFWLSALKKMLDSRNLMTEIRLHAFLYSLWGLISSNESRKKQFCLDWLLREDVFQGQFNHWSPMVRAYFMRLLCWRIGRYDGRGSNLDRKIMETLFSQLNRVWCCFLYLKESSGDDCLTTPSTSPSCPAPGRRLVIVRDDVSMAANALSFGINLAQPSREQATACERYGMTNSVSQESELRPQPLARADLEHQSPDVGKKRWALLKNIVPFTGYSGTRFKSLSLTSESRSGAQPSHGAFSQAIVHERTTGSRFGKIPVKASNLYLADTDLGFPSNIYYHYSFKFSLEWVDKDRKRCLPGRRLYPPKLPYAAQAFLQSLGSGRHENIACKPEGGAVGPSKYAGSALAEWEIIIRDCRTFFEKRRSEGVPTENQVETPTLGVETVHKLL